MKLRWPLILLFLMFLTPALAALYLLNFKDHLNFTTVQHGKFIQPAQNLSLTTTIPHKWNVVYLKPEICAAECQTRQHTLDNLHIALGADQNRVVLITINNKEISNLAVKDDSILIIDPLGFYIMHYAPDIKLNALLKDLKRLLKYSHAT